MLFCGIDWLDEQFTLHRKGYIGVRDGRIAYCGDTPPAGDWGERYDGNHRLLLPGFYNTHCHAAMTLLRGLAEGLPLDRWLHEKIFPFEAKLTPAAIGAGVRLAMAEMLRCGTVSFSDMYFSCDTTAQLVEESGMKCNLGRSLSAADCEEYKNSAVEAEINTLLHDWQGAGNGRITVDFVLHAEYTTHEKLVAAAAEHAGQAKTGMQLHLSETQAEHEACKERHGKTPAAWFADLGVFDVPTTAAHAIWLDPQDRALLREKGVSVACCPASNLKLASGFVDVPALLQAGINVSLGTDGAASNNGLDSFRDMTLLSLLTKGVSGDPTALSPADALRIATRNGAIAQRRFDCGSIAVGNKADLVVVDTDRPWYVPDNDLLSNLVYAGRSSDVVLTMADGRILYRDGAYPTLDLERAFYDAQRFTTRIRNSI